MPNLQTWRTRSYLKFWRRRLRIIVTVCIMMSLVITINLKLSSSITTGQIWRHSWDVKYHGSHSASVSELLVKYPHTLETNDVLYDSNFKFEKELVKADKSGVVIKNTAAVTPKHELALLENTDKTVADKYGANNGEKMAKIKRIKFIDIKNTSTEVDKMSFDVVFNSYMRSGSTFIGKILGNRLNTFYFFEPLWKVAKFRFYHGSDSFCHYFKPYCANLTNEVEKAAKPLNESLDYLQSIFDCTFHRHADYLIDRDFKEFQGKKEHDWSFHKGYNWDQYKSCRESKSEQFKTCLLAAEPTCASADHRVVKLLRMTLDNLEVLLEKNKNLKVIHLFRDPRGILNSHINTGWFGYGKTDPGFVLEDSTIMCERMMHDFQAGKHLQKKFPNRIKFIQYEDIGSISKEKVEKLYDFVGMTLTRKQYKLISKYINPKQRSYKKGFHPYSFRSTLPWETVETVNKECFAILKQLGYTVYTSETHLRNMSQVAAVDPLPFAV